jgi:hypothetical protein
MTARVPLIPRRGDGPQVFIASLGLMFTLILALATRVMAALRLPFHVDESASLLAIKMVIEKGFPQFPSGTLYLQGATFSYLNAPIALVFGVDPAALDFFRMTSVVAGVASVWILMRIALLVTGSTFVAQMCGLMLAVEPLSVRWSGHARMYALLQFFALLLLLLFLTALLKGDNRRLLVGFVVVWYLAIFNHLAVLALWPVFAGVAILRYRRDLFHRRRGLALSLLAVIVAPVVFLLLNRSVQAPGMRVGNQNEEMSFVGDHLISFSRLSHPKFTAWDDLFAGLPFERQWPLVMVGITLLLLTLTCWPARGRFAPMRWDSTLVLLGAYWGPVIAVGFLLGESHSRYLLHIQAVGLLLIAVLAGWLLGVARGPQTTEVSNIPEARQSRVLDSERAAPAPRFLQKPQQLTQLQ